MAEFVTGKMSGKTAKRAFIQHVFPIDSLSGIIRFQLQLHELVYTNVMQSNTQPLYNTIIGIKA